MPPFDTPAPATRVEGYVVSRLSPGLSATTEARVAGYVVSRPSPGLSAMTAACADGAPAARCAAGGLGPFSAAAPVDARTGVGANRTVAHEPPVKDGGWALVGEVYK